MTDKGTFSMSSGTREVRKKVIWMQWLRQASRIIFFLGLLMFLLSIPTYSFLILRDVIWAYQNSDLVLVWSNIFEYIVKVEIVCLLLMFIGWSDYKLARGRSSIFYGS